MKRSMALTLFRLVVIFTLIAGPVAFACHQRIQTKNFRIVREGVLYRSGQMTLPGLQRTIHDYGIRTVVTLRYADDGELPPDLEEEIFCTKADIRYVRIPQLGRQWISNGTGPPLVQKGVDQFLEVMADPRNHPVLVHCFAGVHRTGAYCAIYRMEFEDWSATAALAEMKACGYDNLDNEPDIRGYLKAYPGNRTINTGVISPPTLVE